MANGNVVSLAFQPETVTEDRMARVRRSILPILDSSVEPLRLGIECDAANLDGPVNQLSDLARRLDQLESVELHPPFGEVSLFADDLHVIERAVVSQRHRPEHGTGGRYSSCGYPLRLVNLTL